MSTSVHKHSSPEIFSGRPKDTTETTNSLGRNALTFFKKPAGKITAVAAGLAIAIPAIVAGVNAAGPKVEGGVVGGQENDKPDTIEVNEDLSFEQELMMNVQDRPAQGTPEYTAQFEDLKVPYIEGQDPSEVVQAVIDAHRDFYLMGASDMPGDRMAVAQYMVDNSGKTVYDVVNMLEPTYFSAGFAEVMYGPDWESTIVGPASLPVHEEIHANALKSYASGAVKRGEKITILDPGIDSASTQYDIFANPNLDSEIVRGPMSFHLKAVDTNGDSTPDQWISVGNAN